MRLSDKIQDMIEAQGFSRLREFRIVRGPKSKLDILECWSVMAWKDGRLVELTSGDTMTRLAKGLTIRPNDRREWHYGEYIVEPK